MTTTEAIEILKLHNEWRRGAEIEQQNPEQIGIAIDVLIESLSPLTDEEIMKEAKRLSREAQCYMYDRYELAIQCFIKGATFSRQSFREVDWDGNAAFCNGENIGRISYDVGVVTWMGFDISGRGINVFKTKAEAKSAVEQAWKEFLTKITK